MAAFLGFLDLLVQLDRLDLLEEMEEMEEMEGKVKEGSLVKRARKVWQGLKEELVVTVFPETEGRKEMQVRKGRAAKLVQLAQ